jgi:hypothetical protein
MGSASRRSALFRAARAAAAERTCNIAATMGMVVRHIIVPLSYFWTRG